LTDPRRRLSAGRVGRPHGLDGSFYVEQPADDLTEGTEVTVGGRNRVVDRRAGTDARPIVRVSGISDRDAAEALRGEALIPAEGGGGGEGALSDGEWPADDLIGCRIEGLGEVRRVVEGPSCDVLEVGEDGTLVPFVSDAVTRVDVESRVIEVDRAFLGLDG
jgi:16S rRNA processing protein RimM